MAVTAEFIRLLRARSRWLVLSGAGCSTESEIPDYRDENGAWKVKPPLEYRQFVGSESLRRRYWARSQVGYAAIAAAAPNRAHRALAHLEQTGVVDTLITQNVDGLHQRAGSRNVIDLHGRLDTVVCLACGLRVARSDFQTRLFALNPTFRAQTGVAAPDGDAELGNFDYERFQVPACTACNGLMKPDVVFFGETVPKQRTEQAFAALNAADGLLVVGSSLMVFSGFRFVRAAERRGIPIAIVNRGRTRGDEAAALKVEASCGAFLDEVTALLAAASAA